MPGFDGESLPTLAARTNIQLAKLVHLLIYENPSRSACQHHCGLVMLFLRQICVRFGTTLEMQVDDQMRINRARETPPHTTREPLLLMIKADIGRAKASITLLGQRGSRAPATEEAYVVC